MTATSPGGMGARELRHTALPAWDTDSILHTRGANSSAPREQGGLCVKPKDVLPYRTPSFALTQRKNHPSVSQKNNFWQFVRSAWESSLSATQGERGLSTRGLYPEPALSLCTASSCTLRGKRSPPLPHRKPAVGRCHPASGRGDTAAGVGLWVAEPVDCPPLTLPTFPSKESTSAWLQGSGLRHFVWQKLLSAPHGHSQHELQQPAVQTKKVCLQVQAGPSCSLWPKLQHLCHITATKANAPHGHM